MHRQATPSRDRFFARASPRAFTLVELLIVIAITGILVGMAITQFEPSLHDQLRAGAQVVLSDLSYARSLAVANNSQYRLSFDPSSHEYYLEHSGTNAALNSLPASPYRDPADAATRQTTRLRRIAGLGGQLELATIRRLSSTSQTEITSVEFGPLGALTATGDVQVWLALGTGQQRRYWPIALNATTGVAELGELTATAPASLSSSTSSSLGSSSSSSLLSGSTSGSTSGTSTTDSSSSNPLSFESGANSISSGGLFDYSASGSGTDTGSSSAVDSSAPE